MNNLWPEQSNCIYLFQVPEHEVLVGLSAWPRSINTCNTRHTDLWECPVCSVSSAFPSKLIRWWFWFSDEPNVLARWPSFYFGQEAAPYVHYQTHFTFRIWQSLTSRLPSFESIRHWSPVCAKLQHAIILLTTWLVYLLLKHSCEPHS